MILTEVAHNVFFYNKVIYSAVYQAFKISLSSGNWFRSKIKFRRTFEKESHRNIFKNMFLYWSQYGISV